MKIIILEPNLDDRNCYYIQEFENKEKALEYLGDARDFLREYKIFEANELRLDLRLKETINEPFNDNTNK